MTDEDRIEFANVMGAAAEVFEREISSLMTDAYFASLRDLSIEAVRMGFSVCFKRCRFMPRPVEIREAASGRKTDRALMAWQDVQHAAAVIGPYRSARFEDGTVAAVVRAMGGWERVCYFTEDEMPWRQKDFERLYEAYSERGIAETDYVAGIAEAHNTSRGYLTDGPYTVRSTDGIVTDPARLIEDADTDRPLTREEARNALQSLIGGSATPEDGAKPEGELFAFPPANGLSEQEFEAKRLELLELTRKALKGEPPSLGPATP